MSYLIGFHWGWLLVALILGLVVGWVTYLRPRLRWMDGLVWIVVALVALATIVAISTMVPGRPGYWLEMAVLTILTYVIGCPIGWALRHQAFRDPAAAADHDSRLPKPGYVFRGGTLGGSEAIPAAAVMTPAATGEMVGPTPVPLPAPASAAPEPQAVGFKAVEPPDVEPVAVARAPVEPLAEQVPRPAGAPQPLAVEPKPLAVEPQPMAVEPQPMAVEPQPLAVEPQPMAVEPQPMAVEPQPMAVEPQPMAVEPQPMAVEPQPMAVEPQLLEEEPKLLAAGPLAIEPPGGAPLAIVAAAAPAASLAPPPSTIREDASSAATSAPEHDLSPVVPTGIRVMVAAAPSELPAAEAMAPAPPAAPILPSAPIVPAPAVPATLVETAPLPLVAATASAASTPQKAPPVQDEGRHAGVRPDGLVTARDNKADDLKRIKGIGPQNEGRLHGLGIWHFDQIGAWTPDNVKWVGSYLAFHGRIDREKWIDQAQALASGQDTAFSKRVAAGGVATSKDDGSLGQENVAGSIKPRKR